MLAVMDVSRKILESISSEKSLSHYKVKIIDSSSNETIRMGYQVKRPQSDLTDIDPTFHWGYSNLMIGLGGMSDKLSDLVKNTETPQETLSFNRFENARDAFLLGNYTLALEEINRAIYGDKTFSGYKKEWRFYQLLGLIYIGSFSCEIELVDLDKALQAFLTAAEYSNSDRQIDTAYSFLAAGWVSYCLDMLDKAAEYTSKAIENNAKLSESYFQMAKILMAKGKPKESFIYLGNAIDMDSFFALKAMGDIDFHNYKAELSDYLINLQRVKNNDYKARIAMDINILKGTEMHGDLKKRIEDFTAEKTLLDISSVDKAWQDFKLRPWFYSKAMGEIKIEYDVVVKVNEPYREKVVLKESTWYRKEEARWVNKNRLVEKKKRQKFQVKIFSDTFTFFTGKVLADYNLVLAEGGTFSMGDNSNTGRTDEKPVQNVTLDSFLICTNQVTQKVWNLVMNHNPSNFEGYNMPVEQISWYDCIEFCNRLSIMSGFKPCYKIIKDKQDPKNRNKNDSMKWMIVCDWKADGYRLPTEAEWEFAAKGGNNTNFYNFSGSDDVNAVAWFKDNSGYKTQNAGLKQANELGIYDMSGNVWEWCWDWYDTYSLDPLTNPSGPDFGAYRVLRGGSWADNINYQRSSGRGSESPFGRYSSIGFRLVRAYKE